MTAALNRSQVSGSVQWDFSANDVTGGVSRSSLTPALTLVAGSGANAANKVIVTSYSIAASGTQVIDLNGAINDPLGTGVVSFTKIRAILIFLTTDTTSSGITLAPNSTNGVTTILGGTTPTLTIHNGGFVIIGDPTLAGYGITAGTADQLKITNLDATNVATVQVAFLGE